MNDSTLLDSINITHGIRSVRFSSTTGLYINNENVKLRGCDPLHLLLLVAQLLIELIYIVYKQYVVLVVILGEWLTIPIPSRLDYMDALGMMAIDENRDYGGTKAKVGIPLRLQMMN